MKIHVIDNTGQISPLLLMSEAEVGFFGDEIQALNAAERQKPGLILLNIAMRGAETADYIAMLLSVCADARIVVIGVEISEEDILACLLAGAQGYQDGRQLQDYIGKLIRVVNEGEAWVSRKMVARLLDSIRQRQFVASL